MLCDFCLTSLNEVKPDVIIYQAGVDGLAGDRFGRFSLTREGLMARNQLVYGLAKERGLARHCNDGREGTTRIFGKRFNAVLTCTGNSFDSGTS